MDRMPGQLGLVMDCLDPDALAPFWAEALGYQVIGGAGSYVLLLPGDGGTGPQLLLQRVPEAKTAKNRMHLDVHTPDIEAEAKRLVDLGAVRVRAEHLHEHGTTWILMNDPQGNEFCVCDSGAGSGAS